MFAVNFFARRVEDHIATREECLDTEDPVGAATEYLHARENLRLAFHNLGLARMDLLDAAVRSGAHDMVDMILNPPRSARPALKPLRLRAGKGRK
jgi:hypothetical protein